jgi:hypothetical protein
MLHLLKRHPFPVKAHFGHSLVLTFAFPQDMLRPLLPPGLVLDTYANHGFVAIALVETQRLRPSFLPAWLGQDFFLSGYRIFTRLGHASSALRGLYILRSDTNRLLMARAGNTLTHYHYSLCHAVCKQSENHLRWQVTTPAAEADLLVTADLGTKPAPLPEGSLFPDMQSARRFAGPLPYTFNYEARTNSIITVRGVREAWEPQPVRVSVEKLAYFCRDPFRQAPVQLANAFHLQNVPYRWERGRRIPVKGIHT